MRAPAVLRTAARRTPVLARLLRERDQLAGRVERLEAERDELRAARRELTRERNRLRRELEAGGGRLSAPQELRYLFIVTYGRSGSTLLQGILNSIPGYVIRGENRAALYHLFQHYETCSNERRRVAGKVELDQTHPWYGMDRYPRKLALARIRGLVLDTLIRPDSGARVVGFKEIRWQQRDLPEYVAFVRQVFPEARFLFNTRAHEDVARSKWWAKAADPLEEIARIEDLQREVATSLGDAAYQVHYDDYVRDPGSLRGLFAWLGEDFDEERVRAVMATPHSY